MLPYPSGKLHMGHMRNYTLNDVVYRFMRCIRLQRDDADGLGCVRLARRKRRHRQEVAPAKWTAPEHRRHEGAVRADGLRVRLVAGSGHLRPELLSLEPVAVPAHVEERASRIGRPQVVNWDPVDKTVLANEQVVDGRGWRSGALVEKREIPVLLPRDHATMPTSCSTRSRTTCRAGLRKCAPCRQNWIGRSEGVRFAFPYALDACGDAVDVLKYSRHARTPSIGVTFMAIAPEHPLALDLAQRESASGNPAGRLHRGVPTAVA